MGKIILAVFTAVLFIGCDNYTETNKETKTDTTPPEIERVTTREDTINAMALAFAKQESGFNHEAVSQCGRWVGCLQISEIMVREANRIVGFDCFFNEDRYDRQGSYAIFKIVQEYHNENLEIDKAITLWNPRCNSIYRKNVQKYFTDNLNNINSIENYFCI